MTSESIALSSSDSLADRDDHELLREFADGSEAAFTALVRRYVDLVHSAALRQVRDSHTAADVTSAVFMILARKGRVIGKRAILPAWLHLTTRYVASKALRAQVRRQHHEQEAARMNSEGSEGDLAAAWEGVAPLLDDGLTRLAAKDHEAIVLRFFQNKTFPEMAKLIGSTEEASRKRVDRAVKKLREFLAGRGVVLPAGILIAAMAANSVHASPGALAQSLAQANVTGSVSQLAVETLRWLRWLRLRWLGASLASLVLLTVLTLSVFGPGPNVRAASPLEAFRQLTRAINDGDGARWSSLVHTESLEEQQVRTLLSSNVVVQHELRRGLIERFGQAEYEASGFARVFDDTSEGDIAAANELITGTRATIRLQRGSNLRFVLVDGTWKFDFFRTSPASPAQLGSGMQRRIAATTLTTQEVSQGIHRNARAAFLSFQNRR